MHDSSKKVALVTGANKGIGLGIARELGKAGHARASRRAGCVSG